MPLMGNRLALLLVLAPLILASCDGPNNSNSDSTRSPAVVAVLRFQSSNEQLMLPKLQVGKSVYTDVALRLAKDGTWRLESIGPLRPMSGAEFVQAVLAAPGGTIIDANWRPADATITISRLHIDAKVYGNVALRLTGDTWTWVSELQELFALTLADFKVNPSLVATEAHHVVLRSAPEKGTQSFPLKLSAKVYKFCMDAQDEGADTLRLLDAAGTEVFSLKAGDACANIEPVAGVYTMQHGYGGTGTTRTIFFHPPAPPTSAPTALASKPALVRSVRAASDPNHPEYWAVYFDNAGTSDYLSFTGINYAGGNVDSSSGYQVAFGCAGRIQAIAHTDPYYWPGDTTTRTRYLFDAANFFEITRLSDGTPSGFGLPYSCINWPPLDGSNRSVDPEHHTYALDYATDYNNQDLWIVPMMFPPGDPAGAVITDNDKFVQETLSIANFTNNSFQLNKSQVTQDKVTWPLSVFAGPTQFVGLNYFVSPSDFHLGFRYFPNGLPPSMADASGTWTLATGEVAMFSGSNCTGSAMISEGVSLPYHQPTGSIAELAILGGFLGSLQLGPQTAASVYSGELYQGESFVFNESGCVNFSAAGFAPVSIRVSTDTAAMVVQTNSCEYCNLAGVDLSGLDLTAQGGVKLRHSNLSGAQLSNSNLSKADLRHATLQGAHLNYANLDSANLCLASMNAGTSGAAANLTGAHLRNANLYGANLDGADFTYASFYSATPQSCQQSACDTYALPTCASAYLASMNSAKFPNAYLAGVDMGHTTANGAIFSGAMLFGASFSGANVNRSAGTGAATDFGYAFLQGTDFTNAQVQYASFANAYIDTDSSNNCIQTDLSNEYTGFPGLEVSNTAGQCVAGVQQAPTCIQYIYSAAHLPATDSTNSCPDGSTGPCSTTEWTSPRIPLANSSQPTSTCQPAPLCDGFSKPLNTCW